MTDHLADRLERVRKRRGQTKQAYMLAAVTRAIEEDEAVLQVSESEKRQRRDSRRSETAPEGLGIRPRNHRQDDLPPIVGPPSQPPVTVNIGQSAKDDDTISALAKYVVSGPEYERSSRLRTAVDILRESAGTDQERERLAAQLDAAVGRLVQSQPSTFARAARLASLNYEKLKDILS